MKQSTKRRNDGLRARALAFAAALLLLLCTGCTNDRTLDVATWELDAPGGQSVVTAPSHFEDRLPRSRSSYTLRAHVAVPEDWRGRDLTLVIPQLFAVARLRVAGETEPPLDTDDVAQYRGAGPHRWLVPGRATAHGTLDLALDIDHTWTQSAWLDTVPRLSATPDGDRAFLESRAFNAITASAATTTLLMSAFVYGLVYLLDRQRHAYGWFALHAMGAFYPMFQLGFLQLAIGPWDVVAMGVFVVLGNVSAVHFTHAQFDLGRPHAGWTVACAVTLGAVPFAHGPFASTRVFGALAMCVTIANVIFQIAFFTRRFLRQREVPLHTLAIFASWTILGATALADFGWWLGWGELWHGVHGAHLGIASLAVLQSAALAHEHTRSLKTEGALNRELGARVDLLEQRNVEVQHLNDELRRQIAARSQQISALLTSDARGPAPSAAMRTGDVVEGRYRIERSIGEGGMGAVYEVRRLKDDRRLALKVMHGQTSKDAMARFAREAQLASSINHPNIVGIVDIDLTAGGTLFLVMEYVDGPSLDGQRTRFGDAAWARPILRDVARALAAIHAKGIVHRDLKPANVLLAAVDGATCAKIADFGISTLAHEDSRLAIAAAATVAEHPVTPAGAEGAAKTPLTQTGVIMGTPLYMAPEMLVSARNARPAADVFSFGVMANEMLAGSSPFDGEVTRRLRRSNRPPAPIATRVAGLAPELADLIDRCLASDPAVRPLAEDLWKALA